MTTEIREPKVKRLRIDVYGSFVARPDEGSPHNLEPTIRLYPITVTGQFEDGAYFEGGIPWSAITNLVDNAEAERDQAAVRFGLKASDIEVEYHDMHIPTSRSVERNSQYYMNIFVKFMRKLKL